MRALSTKQVENHRIVGYAAPGATVVVRNLSLAPYAPNSDSLKIVTKADKHGRFVIEAPLLRAGDLMRIDSDKQSPIDVRIPGKVRRTEAEVQGLRVYCKDGVGRFENVLSRTRIADPGIKLRFVNTRDGTTVEATLDRYGALPQDTKITALSGDQLDIYVADAAGDFPEKKWASVIGQTKKPVSPPAANGSNITGSLKLQKVVIDDITVDDPQQGDVGDCWILSTLAGIAHTAPDRIAKMITLHANDTATVTFQQWDRKQRAFMPHPVTVDLSFLKGPHGLVYGHSNDAGEAWVSIIEKAYAEWKGGYEAAAVGYPYAAFEALLGAIGEQVFVQLEDDSALIEKLARATTRPIVAVTFAEPAKQMEKEGLVEDHAYTVLDAYEADGASFVTLRNPWGQFEPRGNGADDGVFTLPLAQFKKRFSYACVA